MNEAPLFKQLPYVFAKKQGIIAISKPEDTCIYLYHLAETSLKAISEAKRYLQQAVRLEKVDSNTFQQEMTRLYQANTSAQDVAVNMDEHLELAELHNQLSKVEDLLEQQDDAPIIRLINALFTQAIKQKASDIHVETFQNRVLIRYRIDGVLQEILDIQRHLAPLIISRIKVMAKLDIAEKRIPQDGRISLQLGEHSIDVRVSTLPSNHGERIVLRILDKHAAQLDLNRLGLSNHALMTVRKMINQPHGILLMTGPTGSGKTTSLYAMLSELNQISRNILTVEDPIEYDLPGIGQTQVNTKADMTFSKGLRAILRQDPDIVMIGEIRDVETAEIAVQASLTGHLVLSTLHTNTALDAITRLNDMGIERFLLASSVIGLMAQRLVRTLCQQCKVAHILSEDEAKLMSVRVNHTVFQPNGCKTCNHTGYIGRTAIYECIPVDDELQSKIQRGESIHDIAASIRPHIPSIREDGFQRVLSGDTSLAEILRVTR